MRKLNAMIVMGSLGLGSTAMAATMDFTDGQFSSFTESPGLGDPVSFSETVDGVTFSFEAIDNLVGASRFIGLSDDGMADPNGLHLAGGGGSTIEFTLTTDKDAVLNSYSTDAGGFFLATPTFDVSGLGVNSIGNSLPDGNPGNAFVGGPLMLTAGEVYTFDIQGTGAGVQAFIGAMDVEAAVVPVPAAAWLMGSGLLGLAAVSRRREG